MKKIFLAAVLLLGLSTSLFAQVYDDPFTNRAVHNARQDAALRGWKLSIDGGGQRVFGYKYRSFNNSRFDAELGYRFNRSNYLGASIGLSSYNYSKQKGEVTIPYDNKKSHIGIPFSLIYRGYFVTERFASPYLYVRGNACTSKIEDVNLGAGLGIEFRLISAANIFLQGGFSGLGFLRGDGFFKSRLQAYDAWQNYSAGPVGDLCIGVSIPLAIGQE